VQFYRKLNTLQVWGMERSNRPSHTLEQNN